MRIGKYITGVKIKFNKKDNEEFITEFSDEIESSLLLVGLCETIDDVCKHYNINTKDILNAYINFKEVKPKKTRGRPRKENKGE